MESGSIALVSAYAPKKKLYKRGGLGFARKFGQADVVFCQANTDDGQDSYYPWRAIRSTHKIWLIFESDSTIRRGAGCRSVSSLRRALEEHTPTPRGAGESPGTRRWRGFSCTVQNTRSQSDKTSWAGRRSLRANPRTAATPAEIQVDTQPVYPVAHRTEVRRGFLGHEIRRPRRPPTYARPVRPTP